MNKLQQHLVNMRDEYVAQNGIEPRYADVLVKFNGEDKVEQQVIRILDESEKDVETDSFFDDDEIFFYTQGFDGLIDLCRSDNGEDFAVVDITDLFEEL